MKNLILFAFVLTLVVGLVNNSFAQVTATASSDAKAYIASGISIENGSALHFGNIVRTAEGGTVEMSTTGELTFNGVYKGQNSNPSVASFDVAGEANYLYTIALPSNITLVNEAGDAKMEVDNFVSTAAGQLDLSGKESFSVGATLHVNPAQKTGAYAGTFNVTVQYQ